MLTVKRLITASFFAFVCLFCSQAFAQSVPNQGFDIRAGLAFPLFWGASATDGMYVGGDDYTINYEVYGNSLATAGFGVNLQAGYRWGRCGVVIEQLISGAFARNNAMAINFKQTSDDAKLRSNYVKKGDSFFFGATFLTFKEYITFTDKFIWSLGEGIGAIYGGKGDHHMFISDSDASFALKGDMAFTYYIMGQYGVGVDFDFIIGLTFDDGVQASFVFTPMLVYNMFFDI